MSQGAEGKGGLNQYVGHDESDVELSEDIRKRDGFAGRESSSELVQDDEGL